VASRSTISRTPRFSGRATTASAASVDERHADSAPLQQVVELSAARS